ncbi:MAG: 16S rRNA (adenine(1518)-N(6)/adenine(1519)-N(6))-dimethyltransferase RsmA [Verrucomicrobia bacterium]|nr:16S rRNA (adenine(1518)-N(6)/adenine(1519)-N(6))-dimethyltransferase RsmA [Cytophagales bacterium]
MREQKFSKVKPKKHFGQHFLTDKTIAEAIVNLLSNHGNYKQVLEIGAGMGVLTDFLIQKTDFQTSLIDIDKEAIAYLKGNYPQLKKKIISGDFLALDLAELFSEKFAVIGNFPYNISSQILFKVLDYKDQIPEIVGMFQKEVAQRIASPPGNKDYGILSVLMQAFYTIEYCFTVEPYVFDPPPKVKSGVLRLKRNEVMHLNCDEKLFKLLVKQGFGNRRKTLRNALKALNLSEDFYKDALMDKRAEQLGVPEFVYLTQLASG